MGWHEDLPKVELHVHLEGSIPHEALLQLIRKYEPASPVRDVAAVAERFAYTDFPHFLEVWAWKNAYLREYDDFTLISELVATDMAAQNIRYAEMFFSPVPFRERGLDVGEVTSAVRRGLDEVPGIEIALIADLVREDGPEQALRAVDELRDLRELGVIGIGIGGAEHSCPPAPFAPAFDRARAAGFHTNAHAGEAEGAGSVWDAIRVLGVERVGHGTRAYEDPALVEHLAEHRIPLEVCPVSNVRTGVVPDLRAHPLRRYFDAGVLVTVNTDDPTMFQTDLAGEYRLLEEECGWERPEIRRLVLNAVEASWLDDERKARTAEEFTASPAW